MHCPAASATMLGGAQSSRSDVTTAHMNSISGERLSREACGPIDSQDKMKLRRRGCVNSLCETGQFGAREDLHPA